MFEDSDHFVVSLQLFIAIFATGYFYLTPAPKKKKTNKFWAIVVTPGRFLHFRSDYASNWSPNDIKI
jgi:hypothetical protein